MHAKSFSAVTRSLSSMPSGREVVSGLAGAALALRIGCRPRGRHTSFSRSTERSMTMNPNHFDTLTCALTESRSRRGTLVSLLGGTLGLFGLAETAARTGKGDHGKGKKKSKKSCPPCKKRNKGKCKKTKPDGTTCPGGTCQNGTCCRASCAGKVCGDDGCGGTCGTACSAGHTCQNGTCRCPSGTELCEGSCLALCAPETPRNPSTCTCCKPPSTPCSVGPGNECCSGICRGFCSNSMALCSSQSDCPAGAGVCNFGFCRSS